MTHLKTMIIIKADWGSQFQAETMSESLEVAIAAIKEFAESKHKDNKIEVKINKNFEPTSYE